MGRIGIEEKPSEQKLNYIILGLYFYDNDVVENVATVKPSARGELEITSVNKDYLDEGKMQVVSLGKEYSWFDAGTVDCLFVVAEAIRKAQNGSKRMACLEEIALHHQWITIDQLRATAKSIRQTQYGKYLAGLVSE